ncbi:MAG: hypothetical protein FWH57_03915 [Oscillospiraceae bacterium]|nr:hypothetical protein [Oscillospiraceae bacterium]
MFLKTARKSQSKGAIRRIAAVLATAMCVLTLTLTASAGSTDVFYMGETGAPVGSYFDASFVNGAMVATFDWLDETQGGFVEGLTLVDVIPMPDVFLANLSPAIDYSYAFGEYTNADAYYAGENGNPVGSYLPGALTYGSYIDTYVDASRWAGLTVGGSIAIPALVEGINPIEYKLTVAATNDGVSSVIYANTFRWDCALDPKTGVALVANSLDEAFDGYAILAVYDSTGRLVDMEQTDVSVSANTAYKLAFDMDVSKYPTSGYKYALFLWDYDYIPVFPAVRP